MMKMMTPHAARAGVASGRTILMKAPKRVQPSMRAASSRSAGMVSK
jgi:hypothetical protein